MTKDDVIEYLRYIADSPPKEYGGFDESIVLIAREALKIITQEMINQTQKEGKMTEQKAKTKWCPMARAKDNGYVKEIKNDTR